MRSYLLTFLIVVAIPGLLFASTYGKPYGATDESKIEKSDVKTIDQLNQTTELEVVQEPVEQEPEAEPVAGENAPVPEPEAAQEENQPPPPELEEPSAQ